jgi:hypothetical protein
MRRFFSDPSGEDIASTIARNMPRRMLDEGGPVHPEDGAMSADDAEGTDRPTEEPEGLTQQDQLRRLREEGEHEDVWFDMTEEEEARLLEAEFGPPDENGIYRAPEGGEGP